MERMTNKEIAAVVLAADDGAVIECIVIDDIDDSFSITKNEMWDFYRKIYRVRPAQTEFTGCFLGGRFQECKVCSPKNYCSDAITLYKRVEAEKVKAEAREIYVIEHFTGLGVYQYESISAAAQELGDGVDANFIKFIEVIE